MNAMCGCINDASPCGQASRVMPRWFPVAIAACLGFAAAEELPAQGLPRRPRPAVVLLSDAIVADSEVMCSEEESLVSKIIGKDYDEASPSGKKAADNIHKWVSTYFYFERRKLNREARAAENKTYMERLEERQELYRRMIEKNLPTLGTDLSDDINKMLREILIYASYSVFLSNTSKYNIPLSAKDCRSILVTDGKVGGKTSVPIRIDDSGSNQMRWPTVLRQKRFETARKAIEDARDRAIRDVQTEREVTAKNEELLKKAIDALCDELATDYPRKRIRAMSYEDFLDYKTARNFLQSLAVETVLLVERQDTAAFDGSYHFHGKTVIELLQHMISKGLEFAPAPPGGQKTYETLYACVRDFYLELVPAPNKADKRP